MRYFVFLCIIAGCIIGAFVGKIVAASSVKKQPVNPPTAGEIWWKNLNHTPLSKQESTQIADRAAELYIGWKKNNYMNHSWLCLGIEANKVVFKQIYADTGEFAVPPTPTIPYSHKISCQDDRELLASYILTAIKAKDSTCKLFLDGDSLILPTNIN